MGGGLLLQILCSLVFGKKFLYLLDFEMIRMDREGRRVWVEGFMVMEGHSRLPSPGGLVPNP